MPRAFLIPGAAAVLALLVTQLEPARAQNSRASMPHSPDLLGIYIGMPADAAKVQLQKHSSDVYVQYAAPADTGFGMSVPGMPTDQISVSITQAPNVPAVWKIERDQSFSGAKPLPRDALLGALRQKYGKETLSHNPNPGYQQLYWLFDSNGQLRPQADAGLMACNAVVPSAMKDEIASRCAQDFFAVYILILSGGAGGDEVTSYYMVLINYPLEVNAAKLTADAKAAADKQAPQKPMAAVPTF